MIIAKNKVGKFDMDFARMGIAVSQPCVHLLAYMVTDNPKQRLSVDQCLSHPALNFDVQTLQMNPQLMIPNMAPMNVPQGLPY